MTHLSNMNQDTLLKTKRHNSFLNSVREKNH